MFLIKYFIFLFYAAQVQGGKAIKVNSQNLVFYNIEDTIIFKKKELIKINGKKYRYLGSIQSNNNIKTLFLDMGGERNIKISSDEILTFQKYKRFPTESIRSGMILTSIINGLFGFILGYSEGDRHLDGPLPGFTGGALMGGSFALFGGIIYGIPLGYIYGVIRKEEHELYYFYHYEPKDAYDYKLKFEYDAEVPLHTNIYSNRKEKPFFDPQIDKKITGSTVYNPKTGEAIIEKEFDLNKDVLQEIKDSDKD